MNQTLTQTGTQDVVAESAASREVLRQAGLVAPTKATVLLLGESGTGKEVLARHIHRVSARHRAPFVAINCAALPEQLLEAELFGYERGAFTGAVQGKPGQLELASGGTLFLDEIGEMPPAAQAKLLRVLQEREYRRLGGTRTLRTDVRVIAATNRNLEQSIAAGQFREDLFYRLNVFPIRLSPLRDRREDILPLARNFVALICHDLDRPSQPISTDAEARLLAHAWPGNARELRNTLERAVIVSGGGAIAAAHLGLVPASTATAAPVTAVAPASSDLRALERAVIERALEAAKFNKSKAARAVGLSRRQLYVRLRRHGLALA
ncbi:MAG TPA: sigma 54-interacting transcriptional regulator [Vicinamibacterales bacterium]|nr:sigma 54-interacting transcriptional regulator [Vicinamibacterales bacterium]